MKFFVRLANKFNMFLRSIRIRTRLLLMVLLAVFVIACTVVLFFYTSRHLVYKKTQEYVSSAAYNIKYNYDTYLATCIEHLNVLATDVSVIQSVNSFNRDFPTGRSPYPTIQNEMYKTARKIPGLVGMEISSLSSGIVYNSRSLTTGSTDSSMILDTIIHSDERITTFGYMELESRPYISNEGRNAVIIGMQIKSHIDGRVVGAVVLALSDEYISTALYPPEDITDSHLVVFDPKGGIITGNLHSLAGESELMSIGPEVTLSRLINLNHSEYLMSQLYTQPLGWRLLLLTDYEKLTAPLVAEYRGAATATLILLLVLLASAILVTNSVNHPMNQIIKAMKDTSRENKFPSVGLTGSDELTYLAITFNDMSQRIQQLIMEREAINEKKRAAELLALQSQINPHLLYNTLDSINWIAFTAGNQDICQRIAALSDFYRLTLDKGQNVHTISKEIKQIESYLRLQQLNYHNKMTYTIDVQPDCTDYPVPKIILQPIVENTLTHGFSEASLKIMVRVYKHNNNLLIDISDNGPGISEYGVNKSFPKPSYGKDCHGYGLYNINERIKLFFGDEFGISLLPNKPKGLLVRFILPTNLYDEKGGKHDEGNGSR